MGLPRNSALTNGLVPQLGTDQCACFVPSSRGGLGDTPPLPWRTCVHGQARRELVSPARGAPRRPRRFHAAARPEAPAMEPSTPGRPSAGASSSPPADGEGGAEADGLWELPVEPAERRPECGRCR